MNVIRFKSMDMFRNKTIAIQAIGLLLSIAAFLIPVLYFFPLNKELNYTVSKLFLVPAFETKAYYMILHGLVVLPVFLLSFDAKVGFYKKWKHLFPAIIIVGVLFILWDILYTDLVVWGFNEAYFLGPEFFSLPIEECMFFLTVPFACVFIYECLLAYFPKAHKAINDDLITIGLASLSLILGVANLGKIYTSVTMLLLGVFLICHYLLIPNTYRSKFFLMFFIALIPFCLVNGALTGSFSQEPIVLYNQEEILGLRVFSIPIEDFFYCMLFLFCVIVLFEYFKTERSVKA